jgi:vacuolar-type H+-ATPase subunit I/STV1
MATDTRVRHYWIEEVSLVGVLFAFFCGILAFSIGLPRDAALFPIVIGSAGVLFCGFIAFEEKVWRGVPTGDDAPGPKADDAAAQADWPRLMLAMFSAPVFGVLLWLFGFFVASLAAMFVMPPMMGYANKRLMLIIGAATVVVLAVLFPLLVGVDLPHGLVGDWLIDTFQQ